MFCCYLAVYWGPRPETAEECADRLALCLDQLRRVHPLFSSWFHKARSRKAANRGVDEGREALTKFLLTGRNRTDVGNAVIPGLGYRVGIWDGLEPGADLMVGCGMAHPRMINAVVLNLAILEDVPSFYEPAVLRAILAALATSWAPDWGTCGTDAWRESQDPAPWTPVIGYGTYLGPARPVPQLVPNATVERVGAGHLVTLGGLPQTVEVETVIAVRAALQRAGSLQPVLQPAP